MPPGARLGDKAMVPVDAHGCPACPHPAVGPAIAGSPDVQTNMRPAIRQDDAGKHAACCGANSWNAAQGSATVFINNKPAVRQGDQTKHCGGAGMMIEGSNNVIIGGSTTGGGPGGSGPRAASPRSSAGGGGGGGGGSAGGDSSGGATGASSGSPADDLAGGRSDRGSAGGGAAGTNAADEVEPDTFTLWIQPEAINGGKLVGEMVSIIDPATKQVVAQAEVDADGNVLVSVPENKPYDLRIDGADDDVPGDEMDLDSLASSHLAVALYDAAGDPLDRGVSVTVRGNGITLACETEVGGHIDVQLEHGVYEIEVEGQTFVADSLRRADLQHEGGAPYEFQLASEVEHDDDEQIARAREDRMTSADLEEI